MPPVLYRWMDERQFRELLFGDGIRPTWTHLAPDTRRLEKGVCFGTDAWSWREEDEYVACVALSTEGLPETLRPIGLDGYAAFRATGAVQDLRRKAGNEESSVVRASLLAEARDATAEWARQHAARPGEPDEWFLRGPIPDARSRVLAVATLNADRKLSRLLEEMSADGSLGFPVHVARAHAGGTPERLEAEMREAFACLRAPSGGPAP